MYAIHLNVSAYEIDIPIITCYLLKDRIRDFLRPLSNIMFYVVITMFASCSKIIFVTFASCTVYSACYMNVAIAGAAAPAQYSMKELYKAVITHLPY